VKIFRQVGARGKGLPRRVKLGGDSVGGGFQKAVSSKEFSRNCMEEISRKDNWESMLKLKSGGRDLQVGRRSQKWKTPGGGGGFKGRVD